MEIPSAYIKIMMGAREPLLERVLRRSLLDEELVPMQVDDNAAKILQVMTMLHKPQKVIEVGTFFGYSSIHIARGLPKNGRLTTIEINERFAALARLNIADAGLSEVVDVVVADALGYLSEIAPESVDMIFLDADKKKYPSYLKACFPLLREGGLLVADDSFALGNFSHENEHHEDSRAEVKAINTYNRAVCQSRILFSAFVGTDNGMLISIKNRTSEKLVQEQI